MPRRSLLRGCRVLSRFLASVLFDVLVAALIVLVIGVIAVWLVALEVRPRDPVEPQNDEGPTESKLSRARAARRELRRRRPLR